MLISADATRRALAGLLGPSFRARMYGVGARLAMRGHVLPPTPWSRRQMNHGMLCRRCMAHFYLPLVERGQQHTHDCWR